MFAHLVCMFSIQLAKENFKFSSSHFTIFSEAEAERLHGHNYYVSLELSFTDWNEELSLTTDFSKIKKSVKEACDRLDEKILLPQKSSFLKISESEEDSGLWVLFSEKKYFFPKTDVALLDVTNVTCESLSKYLSDYLQNSWQDLENLKSYKVTVTETRGQSASFLKEEL